MVPTLLVALIWKKYSVLGVSPVSAAVSEVAEPVVVLGLAFTEVAPEQLVGLEVL